MRKQANDPILLLTEFPSYSINELSRKIKQDDKIYISNRSVLEEMYIYSSISGENSLIPKISVLLLDTVEWTYKHSRPRSFYWNDKKLLMTRIFRAANLCLMRSRKEGITDLNVKISLSVIIIGEKNIWFGWVGDIRIFLKNSLLDFTEISSDFSDIKDKIYIGQIRYGIKPLYYSSVFEKEDRCYIAVGNGDLSYYLKQNKDFTDGNLEDNLPDIKNIWLVKKVPYYEK